jgi:two-component system response regulator (stage 0 sporulation protein F)
VIDDDDGVREVLEDFLVSLGYVAMTAADGVEGLAVLQKRRPDAVLLDITMPGALSGVDTLRVIKKAWPELPVVMVTANAEESLARATLRDGAFDYVMKPVEFGRLREILAAALALGGKLPPD